MAYSSVSHRGDRQPKPCPSHKEAYVITPFFQARGQCADHERVGGALSATSELDSARFGAQSRYLGPPTRSSFGSLLPFTSFPLSPPQPQLALPDRLARHLESLASFVRTVPTLAFLLIASGTRNEQKTHKGPPKKLPEQQQRSTYDERSKQHNKPVCGSWTR